MRYLSFAFYAATLLFGALMTGVPPSALAAQPGMQISPIQQMRVDVETNTLRSAGLACVNQDIAKLTICNTANQCSTVNLPCFPYRCDATARTCGTSCSGNAQCWDGAVCNGGRCVIQRSYCEGNVARNTAGASTQCSPYACDAAAGACKNRCTVSTDCAAGYRCDGSQCVPENAYSK